MADEKCPPITQSDLEASLNRVNEISKQRAAYLCTLDPELIAQYISRSLALIDISKTARQVTGDGIADAYIGQARKLLIRLLGIDKEAG